MSQQPSRNNPGIVQNQNVSFTETVENLRETSGPVRLLLPIEDHQPGILPRRRGILGNQLGRQFEMEIFQTHKKTFEACYRPAKRV